MRDPSTTAERILDAGRRLFNEKGYAATTQTEIAAAVGISQGNLTYHFPTKRDLALRLEDEARRAMRERRATFTTGDVADDYVEHLLFAMQFTWSFRFLLRDRALYTDDPEALRPDADMAAYFAELNELLRRMAKEEMFRRDLRIDLRVLARSLWIVGRYWMDHLQESEGLERIRWADQERGIQHHFAVLLPNLTASARRRFEAALLRASSLLEAREEVARD